MRTESSVTTERVVVTPAMAKSALEAALGSGFKNRVIDDSRVRDYAADMARGNWRLNGETIVFDRDGILIDGQHRMMAIIQTNKAIELLCSFGVEREDAKTIDQGKGRTVANALEMGGTTYASSLVAAARTLHEFRGGVDPKCPTGRRHQPENKLKTVSEVGEFLSSSAPALHTLLTLVPTAIAKACSQSEIAGVAYELSMVESQSAALEWIEGLCGGMPSDDPRQVLRDRLIDDRLAKAERRHTTRMIARQRVQRICLLVQSWNLWIGGHKASKRSFLLDPNPAYEVPVPLPSSIAKVRRADEVNRRAVESHRNVKGWSGS